MKRLLPFAVFIISLLMLLGCSNTGPSSSLPPSPVEVESMDSCSSDNDCVCGGVDTSTGICFLGNKDYQEKYVDRSKDCPDFCSGIAGNLVVKCIDNKCVQMMECIADTDCGSGKCLRNRCEGGDPGSNPDGDSKTDKECSSAADCTTGGCSGELCVSKNAEPLATICLYRPEYDCLEMVECGCIDGKCSWSTNNKYEACVRDAPGLEILP